MKCSSNIPSGRGHFKVIKWSCINTNTSAVHMYVCVCVCVIKYNTVYYIRLQVQHTRLSLIWVYKSLFVICQNWICLPYRGFDWWPLPRQNVYESPPPSPPLHLALCIYSLHFPHNFHSARHDKDRTQTCLSTCRIVSWQLNSTSSINKFTRYDLIVLKCFKNHSEISIKYCWRRGKIKYRFTLYLH